MVPLVIGKRLDRTSVLRDHETAAFMAGTTEIGYNGMTPLI